MLRTIGYLEFTEPTPIQAAAIPALLDGQDVMGLAQTGTGKTAAFGLPLVQNVLGLESKAPRKCAHALILAPTRELAAQIADNMRLYVRGTSLKINVIFGGSNIQRQKQKMQDGTDIIIATPGRLNDLIERGAVKLEATQYLVLDEADQMLDLGFIGTLKKFASLLPHKRQTLLFSATMPKLMEDLAATFLTDPIRIETSTPGKATELVKQTVHFLTYPQKLDKLVECLEEGKDKSSIIFVRTRSGVDKLAKSLESQGFNAAAIHGEKRQSERDRALRSFRSGEIDILVATDVAARGIDVPKVGRVYNFDLPEIAENYIHRIGRTGRAGVEGEAIAFCAAHEVDLLAAIEKTMSMTIDVASGEKPEGKGADKGRPRRGNRKGDDRKRGSRNSDDRKRRDRSKGERKRSDRNSEDRKRGDWNSDDRKRGDRKSEDRKPKRDSEKADRKLSIRDDDAERSAKPKKSSQGKPDKKSSFKDNSDYAKEGSRSRSKDADKKPFGKRDFKKDNKKSDTAKPSSKPNHKSSFKEDKKSSYKSDKPKSSAKPSKSGAKRTFSKSGGVPMRKKNG